MWDNFPPEMFSGGYIPPEVYHQLYAEKLQDRDPICESLNDIRIYSGNWVSGQSVKVSYGAYKIRISNSKITIQDAIDKLELDLCNQAFKSGANAIINYQLNIELDTPTIYRAEGLIVVLG